MGKTIELMPQKPRVVWFIDISEREFYGCQYKDEGASRICPEPHWSICVEAPTVDRLCIMLKKAEEELARSIAARRGKGSRRKVEG